MTARQFDIAIVGAGPAGSSSAISLARKGYSVVLLDKSLFPREKLCGDFLSPISWPLLEWLGVADKILLTKHEEVRAFRITDFSGGEAAFPLASHDGQHPPGLGLRRFYLDDLLVKQAEREGVSLRLGWKVGAIRRERGRWAITMAGPSKDQRFHATFLIGADGRNSFVARFLGMARAKERTGKFVGFQLHLQNVKGIHGEVQIHLFPGGYAGLVRVGESLVNMCFSLDKECARSATSVESLLEERLCRNPNLMVALENAEVVGKVRSTYPVYFSPRRCHGDGFLLAGDAARVTEPVTGEGVYFALKSGELAADAIHQAFSRGDFSARQLCSYQLACKKVFSSRQRVNKMIRALIYRPSLLTPLIRLSSMISVPIAPLVNFVCQTEAPLQQ